jgi:hypothetical protein
MANFQRNWRDLNWHSCSSTAQHMALLIRSSGNVDTYSDRAMVCSVSCNKRPSFWFKLYCPTEAGNGTAEYVHINAWMQGNFTRYRHRSMNRATWVCPNTPML